MPPLTFLRHIESCNRHDPALYRPLLIDGQAVGMLRHDHCEILGSHSEFLVTETHVDLVVGGGIDERSAALGRVTDALGEQGCFKRRDEPYAVLTGWGAPVLATIDRGAVPFFGIQAFGVHVNGIARRGVEPHLWIGTRAMDRAVAPGQLDHLIGGGLPAGLSAREPVSKEAAEEAGIGAFIAGTALPVGLVSYVQDTSGGVKRDTLFVYDLYLPNDFVPHNQDGEVTRYELMPVEQVAALVRDTDAFKENCNLVVIDFLIRHGYLTPEDPDYAALATGLRRHV